MTRLESLIYFLPETILTGTILVLFLVDFFRSKTKPLSSAPFEGVSLLGLLGLVGAAFFLKNLPTAPFFFGMVSFDPMAVFLKILFGIATISIVWFSINSKEMERIDPASYYILLLTLCLGMILLGTSNNLLMIYLSLEMVSIPSYILAGSLRGVRRSSEAALKYVIYGGVSSGIMLYGFSILYGLTGTLGLHEIFLFLSSHMVSSGTLFLAVLLALAGFAYKIAAFPFHMWAPDVYEGAPIPVAAFFSVGPKAAGFAVMIRFFLVALTSKGADGFGELQSAGWPMLITGLAIATMTFGNLAALFQTNLKRLLAYSSIAHAGYMLMGFAALNQEAIQAVLAYLVVYFIMNLGAFLVVLIVYDRLGTENISGYAGLGRRGGEGTYLAVVMSIFLFSLTGIPPFAGFIGKLLLFGAVVKAEMIPLAVIGVLNAVVSLYYYVRIVKVMFFDEPTETKPFQFENFSRPVLVSGLAFLTLLLGIYWNPLAELVQWAAVINF
ncbi:MAG: NADH-quinone oxidoreductase subunit N [bacterium]|nr:NADH-quinone oxidoreductase subunit N [bacterium]